MNTWPFTKPAVFVALVSIALIAALAGYLTEPDSASTRAPLAAHGADPVSLRGSIQSVSPSEIVVRSGAATITLEIDEGAAVEQLEVIQASGIAVGDWLNAGAIPQDQTILTIVGVVVIPAGLLSE